MNLVVCPDLGVPPLSATAGTLEQGILVLCEEGTGAFGVNNAFMVLCHSRRCCRPSSHQSRVTKRKIPVRIALGRSIICFNIAFLSFGVNGLANLLALHKPTLALLILLPKPLVRQLDVSANPLTVKEGPFLFCGPSIIACTPVYFRFFRLLEVSPLFRGCSGFSLRPRRRLIL